MICLLQTYKIILWLLFEISGVEPISVEMFNAGVLLINNALWKQENMTQKLIDLTNEWHDKVDQADQSILNMLFENKMVGIGL